MLVNIDRNYYMYLQPKPIGSKVFIWRIHLPMQTSLNTMLRTSSTSIHPVMRLKLATAIHNSSAAMSTCKPSWWKFYKYFWHLLSKTRCLCLVTMKLYSFSNVPPPLTCLLSSSLSIPITTLWLFSSFREIQTSFIFFCFGVSDNHPFLKSETDHSWWWTESAQITWTYNFRSVGIFRSRMCLCQVK